MGALLLAASGAPGQSPEQPNPIGPARFNPIDLQSLANQRRSDDLFEDDLPDRNLSAVPAGDHRLLGVSFQIGEGVLLLGSQFNPEKPGRFVGIKVGKRFSSLYFLHAEGWPFNEKLVPVARYVVHYADGTVEKVPIVNGKDIGGWWKHAQVAEPTDAKIAWEGSNDGVKPRGGGPRLFLSAWENPKPNMDVVSIDFVSEMTKCAPFCVAITVAEPLRPALRGRPGKALDLEGLWTELAGEPNRVYDAVEALAATPMETLPYLRRRLIPGASALQPKIGKLIDQLDADNFAVREKASKELEMVGLEALGRLRRALSGNLLTPEAQRRAEHLVEKFKTLRPTPDQRRSEQALVVLEVIANDEARQMLGDVSRGSAGEWLAPNALASLKRLAEKK
jgi:hypothetical protein